MSRIRVHSVRSIKRSSRLRPKATIKNVPAPRRLTQAQVDVPEFIKAVAPVFDLANDNGYWEIVVEDDKELWL